MKKIFYIFAIFLFISGATHAAECNRTCSIADAPAPVLTEYFTNVDAVGSNILSGLSAASSEAEENVRGERNRILASLNSLLSFDNYFSSFDYYVTLPITNDVPPEVKRDHDRLLRNTERFTDILKRAEQRNIGNTAIDNICDGISNCPFESGVSARDALTTIIGNNEKITELYRGSILDKAFGTREDSYILVSDDFRFELEQYYNKDTLTACSSCEGGFTDRIRESISNIGSLNADAREGIQNWKNAWVMLRGGRATPGYEELEARLLAEYLETQGISSEQAAVVMDNLARYNSGALTSSNPLFNSASYSLNRTKDELKTFEEALREKLGDNEDDTVPYREITRVEVGLKDSEDIRDAIESLYEEQLPAAQVQDTVSQELQARIIRMHFSLLRSIEYLQGNIRNSERVCNRAGPRGRCEY